MGHTYAENYSQFSWNINLIEYRVFFFSKSGSCNQCILHHKVVSGSNVIIFLNIDQKILTSWLHISEYVNPLAYHAQLSQQPEVFPRWNMDKGTGIISVFRTEGPHSPSGHWRQIYPSSAIELIFFIFFVFVLRYHSIF